MRHPIPAVGCLLLVLSACSGLTGIEDYRAELRTDRSEYSIGEEMIRTLTNTGEARFTIAAGACFADLEHQVNGTWERRGGPEDCILKGIEVPPGEVKTDSLTLTDARYEPGGTYRFVAGIRGDHQEDRAMAVHSNSFTVTE